MKNYTQGKKAISPDLACWGLTDLLSQRRQSQRNRDAGWNQLPEQTAVTH